MCEQIPWLLIFVCGVGYVATLALADRIERRAERHRRSPVARGTR